MRPWFLLGLLTLGSAFAQPAIDGCPVLPADNIWNTPIDHLPVHSSSATWVQTIGATRTLKADFGSGLWNGGPIGIPFITVPGTQQKYPATFLYDDESDPGPYAVPLNAPIEGGSNSDGDRHAIAIDKDNCILYELYRAFPGAASWQADSGAIYNLRSNALRPLTWTSADAAGLPIVPGLVRYDEVLAGEIRHAVRFTVPQTKREFVWPARHYASSLTGVQYPPMGARFRLKAGYDISGFSPQVQVILRALKKYGMMLADNGSAWYISGAPDERWNNTMLNELKRVLGSDLEAVDATTLRIDPNSGQARQNSISVSIAPAAATLTVGRTQTFTAAVNGTTDQGVTWKVNGVAGGNSTYGTIAGSGVYYAPSVIPSPATYPVSATSTADPNAAGSANVTIVAAPSISSLSPSPLTAGAFTLTVNGAGFRGGDTIAFNAAVLPTTHVSASQLRATGSANAATGIPVEVRRGDGATSNSVPINVINPPQQITVTVTPSNTTVRIGKGRQFAATVTGATNKTVVWKVNGVIGGSSSLGTITTSGYYRAPRKIIQVTVSATSAANGTSTGSATVNVVTR